MRHVVWGVLLANALAVCPRAHGQQAHLVSGVVSDSATGRPLAAALVELKNVPFARALSDETGSFRMSTSATGPQQLIVRRLGYREASRDVELAQRDTGFVLSLAAITQTLDTVRVRAGLTAIYGVVGTSASLQPLEGAAVRVLGTQRSTSADSAGHFVVPLEKSGTYIVRVTHVGFAPFMMSVDVPIDHAAEVSTLLETSPDDARGGANAVWDELDERLRWRGRNSALVSERELSRLGSGTVTQSLESSPSFAQRGLRIGPSTCVFINGVPRPNLPLDGIAIESIAAVEAYGRNGDDTKMLSQKWPPGAACGATFQRGSGTPPSATLVRFIVVWLKTK